MIAVIFEVELKKEGKAEYLALAQRLKQSLVDMPGFISVERFQSLAEVDEGAVPKILSLSYWQDEASIKNWRQQDAHSKAQVTGRDQLFCDYRIRVAHVVRDYSLSDRQQAPSI